MGKEKKAKSSSVGGSKRPKTMELSEQILTDTSVRSKNRNKTRNRMDGDESFVDDKMTKKILEQARKQQAELEEEHGVSSKTPAQAKRVSLSVPNNADSASEDENEEFSENEDYYEDLEIDEEDEKEMEKFMSKNPPAQRTLADLIMEKVTEKQTEINTHMTDNASVLVDELDERVVNMYQQVKTVLVRYRSGKLPKAFKIIPSLTNWEQVLHITEPDTWSAAAMYQATRIFASNLNSKMAQRFFNLVLLPRVLDDIQEYKRLNFHLYMAVKKSLFKPSAFFKGILLPLCESGDCSLRVALIFCSILAKCSIPMLHSAAAILKIAEMDYYGANSMFLRVLLSKKYALPYRVTDAVVDHFLRFQRQSCDVHVLWHQSLLAFVQHYKEDISSEQKAALMELLRARTHPSITPEIRRELVHAKCRDEEMSEPPMETTTMM